MWTALAGGVGGAKLALGLVLALPAPVDTVRIVVNTGDDFTHLGLRIAPDIDTMLYTLGGIANPTTGWGIAGDTTAMLDQLRLLGGETWFWLGDRDLATHLFRTEALRKGETPTAVTRSLTRRFGIAREIQILPMSDDPVATEIQTPEGWLAFQEYFVRRRHADPVRAVRFAGIDDAKPTTEVLQALREATMIVFCPSNPIVSIAPILALPGVREAIVGRAGNCPRVAISPIIGGQALKGPADQMLAGLGHAVSALGVAQLYTGLIDYFVLDEIDRALAPAVAELGMHPIVTKTIMHTPAESEQLARAIARAVGW